MRKPVPQELYRHFKGGRYQIITLAKDADTGEELVVYQALYGEFTVYCRPLSEFTSEVDKNKYPNADQRMRFERFEPDTKGVEDSEVSERKETVVTKKEEDKASDKKNVVTPSDSDDLSNKGDYMNRTIEEEAKDFGMNPLVVRFLDADSSSKRLEVLNLIRPVVTNEMIDVMAMAIDTEVPGDDPELRCQELRECLLTKQRFEVTRLRS